MEFKNNVLVQIAAKISRVPFPVESLDMNFLMAAFPASNR